jgi:hypothetical protein
LIRLPAPAPRLRYELQYQKQPGALAAQHRRAQDVWHEPPGRNPKIALSAQSPPVRWVTDSDQRRAAPAWRFWVDGGASAAARCLAENGRSAPKRHEPRHSDFSVVGDSQQLDLHAPNRLRDRGTTTAQIPFRRSPDCLRVVGILSCGSSSEPRDSHTEVKARRLAGMSSAVPPDRFMPRAFAASVSVSGWISITVL